MSTPKDFRDTWDSERWVIDRLVEAVEAGDGGFRDRLAKRLLDGYSEHDWCDRRVNDAGLILPTARLDPRHAVAEDVLDALEPFDVSEERLAQISAGAALTDSEISLWRDLVVERAFDSERVFECGEGNVCVVVELKHSDRRRAHLALRNWDGQSGVLVAACLTYTDALAGLRSFGIVSMDDYLMWRERFGADSRFRE